MARLRELFTYAGIVGGIGVSRFLTKGKCERRIALVLCGGFRHQVSIVAVEWLLVLLSYCVVLNV